MKDELRKCQEYVDAVFFIEACSRGEYSGHEDIAKKEGSIVLDKIMEKIYEYAKKRTLNDCYKLFMQKVRKFEEEFTDLAVIQNIKDNYVDQVTKDKEEVFI